MVLSVTIQLTIRTPFPGTSWVRSEDEPKVETSALTTETAPEDEEAHNAPYGDVRHRAVHIRTYTGSL